MMNATIERHDKRKRAVNARTKRVRFESRQALADMRSAAMEFNGKGRS